MVINCTRSSWSDEIGNWWVGRSLVSMGLWNFASRNIITFSIIKRTNIIGCWILLAERERADRRLNSHLQASFSSHFLAITPMFRVISTMVQNFKHVLLPALNHYLICILFYKVINFFYSFIYIVLFLILL